MGHNNPASQSQHQVQARSKLRCGRWAPEGGVRGLQELLRLSTFFWGFQAGPRVEAWRMQHTQLPSGCPVHMTPGAAVGACMEYRQDSWCQYIRLCAGNGMKAAKAAQALQAEGLLS